MTRALAQRLLRKYYNDRVHPYRTFESHVDRALTPSVVTLMDAGCGRDAPVLRRYLGRVPRLLGSDLVEFGDVPPGIEVHRTDLAHLPIEDDSVDIIMSRSVFEHLTEPESVYRELARVLKPGGCIIFLTANLWDYGTLVSMMIPNRFHAKVVRLVEGREECDTFPTAYKSNSRSAVERLARQQGLRVESFEYLSQYPNYLLFNGALFWLGSLYERLIHRFNALRLLRGWILVTLRKPAA